METNIENTHHDTVIPGTRMRVDWEQLISGCNIELPRLPENHTNSLRLGNGGSVRRIPSHFDIDFGAHFA